MFLKNSLILDQFKENKTDRIPFWFMRQAGRYLPEYKEVRKTCSNFIEFCYSPKKSCEVTLQPIRRFGMDAAIIFSDILVIPDALGMKVEFIENEGPKLQPIDSAKALSLSEMEKKLSPVYEAIELTRKELPNETSLFGFAGSPWTLACYMLEGKSSKEFEQVKIFSIKNKNEFSSIIDVITEAVTIHLKAQVKAGADILQLFDSWSGITTAEQFNDWVITPTKKIVSEVKKEFPEIPIIGFPRNAGVRYQYYAAQTGVDGVSFDMATPASWIKENIQQDILVQGNLDPLLLAYDIEKAKTQAMVILETLGERNFIFNLGHGIIQYTPPEHVEIISKLVRDYRR